MGNPWDRRRCVHPTGRFVGVHGLTLATILLAAVPALGWRWCVGGGVVLVAWVAFGMTRLHQPMHRPLPLPLPLTVVLVQGNVAQGQKFDQAFIVQEFRHYLELTAQGRAEPAMVPRSWSGRKRHYRFSWISTNRRGG